MNINAALLRTADVLSSNHMIVSKSIAYVKRQDLYINKTKYQGIQIQTYSGLLYNIEIIHVFHALTFVGVLRKLFEHEAVRPSCPRDRASVNAYFTCISTITIQKTLLKH